MGNDETTKKTIPKASRLRKFWRSSDTDPIYGASLGRIQSQRTAKVRFRLLLTLIFFPGVVLAGISWNDLIITQIYPQIDRFLREALPRLGDALIIAPLLAFLVEVAAAHELLDKFVGERLPPYYRPSSTSGASVAHLLRRWGLSEFVSLLVRKKSLAHPPA